MINGTDQKEPEIMDRDRRIELRVLMSTDLALVRTVLRALRVQADAIQRFETWDAPSDAEYSRGLKGAP